MPHYYFHIQSGEPFFDEDGIDFETPDAARIEATKLLSEIIADRPENLWLDQTLSVTVKDDGGSTVFRLDLTVTNSPQAPPSGFTRR